MTWLPTGASSPQVRLLITRLAPERHRSPLRRARRVSSCRGVNGQSPAKRGLKVENPPEEGRRSANPSRGEVC